MKFILFFTMSLLVLCSCGKGDDVLESPAPTESAINFRISVDSTLFTGVFYTTEAAKTFRASLPLTFIMSDLNGHEKYCALHESLPISPTRPGTIRNGDLMLYGTQTLALFYKTFSSTHSYTRIGRIYKPSGLEKALGRGRVSVRFELISQVVQYTLTYNANEATSGLTPSAVTLDQGSRISLNDGTSLSRRGYIFVGWNTNASGTGIDYAAGSSYTLNSHVTLYAKWEPVSNSSNIMKITIGNTTFTATLATNATATAFKALLPLTLSMRDFNNNEKVCSLPSSLTTSASNPGTIHEGDIMLYGSSSLVLFYETFSTSYSYTRIGQIDHVSGLKSALGPGNISVKFELE